MTAFSGDPQFKRDIPLYTDARDSEDMSLTV